MLTQFITQSIPVPEKAGTSGAFCPIYEPFVNIAEYSDGEIFVDMYYCKQNLNGAVNNAYVRKTVGDMLLKAQSLLPEGYHLKIWDAWRPYEVQKSLFDGYYNSLKNDERYKNLSDSELIEKAKEFVSFPDKSKNPSFVHSSGGAVDLTITDSEGRELDMGTVFDDFSERAYTDFFEKNDTDHPAKLNRRILYNIMVQCGFTNYPAEWWHYDYGDIFYAAVTGSDVKYGSAFSTQEVMAEGGEK